MNQSAGSQRHIHRILPFLLFTVFALCIMAVLCSGAHSYRALTHRDQTSYHRRTCVQYLSTRVRQATSANAISLTRFGEGMPLPSPRRWMGRSTPPWSTATTAGCGSCLPMTFPAVLPSLGNLLWN